MDIVEIPGSRIVTVARAAFATPDVDFLCFGESDQPTPDAVRDAGIAALRDIDTTVVAIPAAGVADCLAELTHTAYACAAINAAVCASYPPRLFARGRAARKLRARALGAEERRRLAMAPGGEVREVMEHPLLDLLEEVNAEQDPQELWELTTLHQETVGSAYWSLEFGGDGLPRAIWTLPAHRVRAVRRDDGAHVPD